MGEKYLGKHLVLAGGEDVSGMVTAETPGSVPNPAEAGPQLSSSCRTLEETLLSIFLPLQIKDDK